MRTRFFQRVEKYKENYRSRDVTQRQLKISQNLTVNELMAVVKTGPNEIYSDSTQTPRLTLKY